MGNSEGPHKSSLFFQMTLLGSAALWGGSYLFTKTALEAMTFMEFLVAGILYLVMSCLSFSGPSVAWLRPEVVSSVLFLIVCASMGAQIMENMSLPHLPGSQASIIMCTECLFAAVFSAIFAGERFTMNTVIGFALIFTAMVMSAKCSEE